MPAPIDQLFLVGSMRAMIAVGLGGRARTTTSGQPDA